MAAGPIGSCSRVRIAGFVGAAKNVILGVARRIESTVAIERLLRDRTPLAIKDCFLTRRVAALHRSADLGGPVGKTRTVVVVVINVGHRRCRGRFNVVADPGAPATNAKLSPKTSGGDPLVTAGTKLSTRDLGMRARE